MKTVASLFIYLLGSGYSGFSQGFVNLNFEAAQIIPIIGSPYYPYEVNAAAALPGWTGYLGNTQVTNVLHNDFTLSVASIDIFDSGFSVPNRVLEGQYTVVLQAGGYSGGPANASISQVGTIPANATSIQMMVRANNFSVSFAGNNLVMIPLATTSTYTLYGADVASYAGQPGALTITAIFTPGDVAYLCRFDAISFSSTAIPEPSALSLVGLGLLGLGWQWRSFRGQTISGVKP